MSFIRGLNEEIKMLIVKYPNGELLIMGDFNCRIEDIQSVLCTFSDVWEKWSAEKYNSDDKRRCKVKNCNVERKKFLSVSVTKKIQT